MQCQKKNTTLLTLHFDRLIQKTLCKGAKYINTHYYKPIKFYCMETIKLNGENWTNVVNSDLKTGAKLTFEDGFKCTVIEYYKAHYFKKGSKTALKIQVGKDVQTIETDKLRSEHCPQYKSVPHKNKVKTFQVVNLELATIEQLKDLQKQIESELKRREENKQRRIAELQRQLAELQA